MANGWRRGKTQTPRNDNGFLHAKAALRRQSVPRWISHRRGLRVPGSRGRLVVELDCIPSLWRFVAPFLVWCGVVRGKWECWCACLAVCYLNEWGIASFRTGKISCFVTGGKGKVWKFTEYESHQQKQRIQQIPPRTRGPRVTLIQRAFQQLIRNSFLT